MKNDLIKEQEEEIVQYLVGQALFTKSTHNWKCSLCFTGVVGRSLPSSVAYWKKLNLYKEFQFIGKLLRSLNTLWQ